MAHPTMIEIADIFKQNLDDAIKIKENHNEPILVDRYTLVWAEYWLRWAKEHVYIKDFTMPESCTRRLKMTEKELLTEVKKGVQSMAVEPPWCENIDFLRKWIEGFETCQQYTIYAIDSMITKLDNESQGGRK